MLSEFDNMKRKFELNAEVSKDFPFKPEKYNYNKPSINVGNELYMISNMDYDRLPPLNFELRDKHQVVP